MGRSGRARRLTVRCASVQIAEAQVQWQRTDRLPLSLVRGLLVHTDAEEAAADTLLVSASA